MKNQLKNTTALLILLFSLFVTNGIYAQTAKADKSTATYAVEQTDQVNFLAFDRTELIFGRNRVGQPEVSEAEFAAFLADTITQEFPDGLTVIDGIGQFRDASGNIIQEKAKVLILLYPTSTRRQSSRGIERIRNAYKARFNQQSVLRIDDVLPSKVSF